MPMPRDWDASTYNRVSAPLEAMGREVLDRLTLRGDERVLDAGCGSGRVSRAILDRLPDGHLIAVDGSPAMIEQARAALPPEVELHVVDLVELQVDETVDAILSTATFHWIADHDRLFARLHAALRPGGELVAQCGGEGNVAAVKAAGHAIGRREPFAPHLAGWAEDWNFQTPEATEARLRAAGFVDVWCWRTEVRVEPDDPTAYLSAICLGSFLERLPPELREAFVQAALEELDTPFGLDYVRLNILARRPS
jgi:trans-aconitate 2-methyltransferase